MDIIVDIQFFEDSKNIVVPKEICVIDLASGSIAHWIVAPVTPIDSLSLSARIENNWLRFIIMGLTTLTVMSQKKQYPNH